MDVYNVNLRHSLELQSPSSKIRKKVHYLVVIFLDAGLAKLESSTVQYLMYFWPHLQTYIHDDARRLRRSSLIIHRNMHRIGERNKTTMLSRNAKTYKLLS